MEVNAGVRSEITQNDCPRANLHAPLFCGRIGCGIWCACIPALFGCGDRLHAEIICNEIRRKPLKLADLEASAVGLLVTLMMPPTVSYAVVIIACIFAIIIGRQIFGGSENPVFPAAAVGYVFAQLTWRSSDCAARDGKIAAWNMCGYSYNRKRIPFMECQRHDYRSADGLADGDEIAADGK